MLLHTLKISEATDSWIEAFFIYLFIIIIIIIIIIISIIIIINNIIIITIIILKRCSVRLSRIVGQISQATSF